MKKIEAARLAGAMAQVSNNGLDPKKGLKLFRFYQILKGIQAEVREYEQKLRSDFGIKKSDNDIEMLKKYNEALAEMLNEDADIKVDPFLTEEEAIEILGKVLTMEGLSAVIPVISNR